MSTCTLRSILTWMTSTVDLGQRLSAKVQKHHASTIVELHVLPVRATSHPCQTHFLKCALYGSAISGVLGVLGVLGIFGILGVSCTVMGDEESQDSYTEDGVPDTKTPIFRASGDILFEDQQETVNWCLWYLEEASKDRANRYQQRKNECVLPPIPLALTCLMKEFREHHGRSWPSYKRTDDERTANKLGFRLSKLECSFPTSTLLTTNIWPTCATKS